MEKFADFFVGFGETLSLFCVWRRTLYFNSVANWIERFWF